MILWEIWWFDWCSKSKVGRGLELQEEEVFTIQERSPLTEEKKKRKWWHVFRLDFSPNRNIKTAGRQVNATETTTSLVPSRYGLAAASLSARAPSTFSLGARKRKRRRRMTSPTRQKDKHACRPSSWHWEWSVMKDEEEGAAMLEEQWYGPGSNQRTSLLLPFFCLWCFFQHGGVERERERERPL